MTSRYFSDPESQTTNAYQAMGVSNTKNAHPPGLRYPSNSSVATFSNENRDPSMAAVPVQSIWGDSLRSFSNIGQSKLLMDPPSAPAASLAHRSFVPYNMFEPSSAGQDRFGGDFGGPTQLNIFRPKTGVDQDKPGARAPGVALEASSSSSSGTNLRGVQGSKHAPPTSMIKTPEGSSVRSESSSTPSRASYEYLKMQGNQQGSESGSAVGGNAHAYGQMPFRSSFKSLEEKDKMISELKLQVEAMTVALSMATPSSADQSVKETVKQMTMDAQGMTHRILTRIRNLKEENQRLATCLSQGKTAQMELENGILRRENESLQSRIQELERQLHN